jgi:hypothetical protein
VTDLQAIINAVREARLILHECPEHGSSNAEDTVQQLREILDGCELNGAIEGLERSVNELRLANELPLARLWQAAT